MSAPTPRLGSRERRAAVLAALFAAVAAVPPQWVHARSPATLHMSSSDRIAPGIDLFRSADASVLDAAAPGPVQMALVRVDPTKARLATALAHGCAPAREPVAGIADRADAVVAINGGFFSLETGAPVGLLKHRGRWIGGASRARGAVGFSPPRPGGPARVVFARVTFAPELRVRRGLRWTDVPVDRLSGTGIQRGLTFSPMPCKPAPADSAAGAGGDAGAKAKTTLVWRLRSAGPPPTGDAAPRFPERHGASSRWIVDATSETLGTAAAQGHALLTFRGPATPAALASLRAGQALTVDGRLLAPDARAWRDAPDAVGGAGLLVTRGGLVTDWSLERTDVGFRTGRHPRSLIGVDGAGAIWLVAVDGRQPGTSVGMSFGELQRLARRLDLREALNLDGGGSTTLVVRGRVVNQPSDPTGPRPVSDAIVVHPQ